MRPLAVAGNVNVDLILGPAEPWPAPGTEVVVARDELRVGGAAGNTALAWMALCADFQIAGSAGSDLFGRWLADAFGGRAARWRASPEATTVAVGITHPDGERTFFTSRGHLPDLSWPDVRAVLEGGSLAGGLLLLCGSFLTARLTADYAALFDWADAQGAAVALDTGWPPEGWTPAAIDQAWGWIARSRHLLINESEAKGLTGRNTIERALEDLAGRLPPGGVAVVKAGPGGAFARAGGGQTIHAPARPVAVVDTIGAGDVFNAGYLHALAAGSPVEDALAFGVELASTAISTSPRPYRAPTPARPRQEAS